MARSAGSSIATCRFPARPRGNASDSRVPVTNIVRPSVVAFVLLMATGGSASAGTITVNDTWYSRADTFAHSKHVKVKCLECHRTGERHGRLTFERPLGCAGCHHQSPASTKCETCHQPVTYGAAKQATMTVTLPGRSPNPRRVEFLHARHTSKSCVVCHTTPVTLAPSPATAACRNCHAEHHGPERTCSSCHRISEPRASHQTLDTAHRRCDACHTATTVARLTPTRSFCSACHAAKTRGHYDAKECSTCHFLATPAEYQSRLSSPPQ